MSQSGQAVNSGGAGTTRYPITPFVVGPVGSAGYQTIQSAINAANTGGIGGLVFIQEPGNYTENLILYGGVDIQGASYSHVTITGTHSLPASGIVQFSNICLSSSTAIINDTSSGSQELIFDSCLFTITNGYVFNLPNWIGTLYVTNCLSNGTVDGFLLNDMAFGLNLFVDSSNIGAGYDNSLSTSGTLNFTNSSFNCPLILNSFAKAIGCSFYASITFNDGIGYVFSACNFSPPNTSALIIECEGVFIFFSCCFLFTQFSPAIGGTGTINNVVLSGISFVGNSDVNPVGYGGVSDKLNCGSGVITAPSDSVSSSLVLGTAFQNTTGYDVLLHVYISVTSATAGSILCGVGATTTPTQQTIVNAFTTATATIIPVSVYLPVNYYALISTSGTITRSISGQQLTTV